MNEANKLNKHSRGSCRKLINMKKSACKNLDLPQVDLFEARRQFRVTKSRGRAHASDLSRERSSFPTGKPTGQGRIIGKDFKVAFLWGDLDPDQRSTLVMMDSPAPLMNYDPDRSWLQILVH